MGWKRPAIWSWNGEAIVNVCSVMKTREARFHPPAPERFPVTGRGAACVGGIQAAPPVRSVDAGVRLFQSSSHKKYRAALKKAKRKKRRQELARLRDSGNRLLSPFSVSEIALSAPVLTRSPSARRKPSTYLLRVTASAASRVKLC